MNEKLNLLAFDVGNNVVRTILCVYENGVVRSEEILVEPNVSFEENGFTYWDMDADFASMKRGLALAAKTCGHIDSVGICTWGVDFRLLDENGNFVAPALSYRNAIGGEEYEKLSEDERTAMFNRTGILCDKINSVYMLRGMQRHLPDVIRAGKKLLMVPDVFVYLFTGVAMNEPSELSTSQMMDVRSLTISAEQCAYAGVSPDIFSEIGIHGKAVGRILPSVLAECGIGYDIPVICVPSHDTASAVMGIPALEENYLFVSSGTWALIGAQCREPLVSGQTMRAKLTNETGAFGRTTLLRNSAGMFILQRLKPEYEAETGQKTSWDEFTSLAAKWEGETTLYDVNDSRYFNPQEMAREIRDTLHPGDGAACGWPELLASTYASLGESYAETLRLVTACTGGHYDRVFVVGGGSRNAYINQRCADSLGLPVVACDMECSSVGNAVVQIAHFHPEFSYEELRKIVYRSLEVKTFQSRRRETL